MNLSGKALTQLYFYFLLFFNHHLQVCLLISEREMREKEREREKEEH